MGLVNFFLAGRSLLFLDFTDLFLLIPEERWQGRQGADVGDVVDVVEDGGGPPWLSTGS